VKTSPEAMERAFSEAFGALDRRIELFLKLPLSKFDSVALGKELKNIGRQ